MSVPVITYGLDVSWALFFRIHLRPFVFFELRDRLDEGVGRETGTPHEESKVDCGRGIEHEEKSTSMMHLSTVGHVPSPSSVTNIRP